MATPSLESVEGGYKLRGAVTLLTAPSLLAQLPAPSNSKVDLDLSETHGSDSSIVALLLAWVRHTKGPVICQNVPDEITSLMDLYGVQELLLQ